MTLVNKEIPALYNGVSQQPASVRLTSQAEEQVNALSSVVDGVSKRPPSEHIVRVSTEDLSAAYTHTINRDANEKYVVVIADGTLRVFGLDGVEKVVTFPAGSTYLTTDSPKDDIVCVTVADYTFVLNKTVTVAMGDYLADTIADPDYFTSLSRSSTDDDSSTLYEPNTPVGNYKGSVTSMAELPTDAVVNDVWLVYTIEGSGEYSYWTTGVYYRWTGSAWVVNTASILKGSKQTIDDLPTSPAEGDMYEITGTGESSFANYYVRREGGVWQECVKPGLKNKIDATTMPHALVRVLDGSFVFAPFSWAPRRVGDSETNPNPTFVGRKLRDVFFDNNRLGFLTDENVVASAAGDFGNYYRLTVTQLLNDSVVDVAASETKVTKLEYAVPFNKTMMVFSEEVQFALNAEGGFTPTTVSLVVATQYRMSLKVKPIAQGSDVYFVAQPADAVVDDWAHLYEYYVRDTVDSNDAADITAHVPKYVPAGVFKLTGSAQGNILFALSSLQPNRLYVYSYYWSSETEKAQSSWSYWKLGDNDTIINADVVGDFVLLLVKRSDGTYFERIRLQPGLKSTGLPFRVLLDRLTTVTGMYVSAEDRTYFTLPYPIDHTTARIVLGGSFANAGQLLDPASYVWTSTAVSVPGNQTAGTVFLGENYETRYTFSEIFMRDARGNAILSGRLTLKTFAVAYQDTAYFKSEVYPYGVGDPETVSYAPGNEGTYSGRFVGDASLLGKPVFGSGVYQFGVYGDSRLARITLINDGPYPSTFTSAQWEGDYNARSRNIA